MDAACPRLCLVTADGTGLNASGPPAEILLGAGCHVHVLVAGAAPAEKVARNWAALGIDWSSLADFPASPEQMAPSVHHPLLQRSEHVRHALEQLHRRHHFHLIEFPAGGGLGFRTLQAKRAGLVFQDVAVVVRLDWTSPWVRDRDGQYLAHPDDLELDFAERYVFEQADHQACPSVEVRDHAGHTGWTFHAGATQVFSPNELVEIYKELARRHPPLPTASPANPLVTITVPYFNLGKYLPETLASLAAQTYPHLEVLVINDGSTDAHANLVFAEQKRLYPQFRFLEQPNAGIGATRNRGLREARGEFFLPVDADNVAFPHMVECLVRGLRSDPGLAAMTCFHVAFRDSADLKRQQYLYACRPTGGPRVMASFRNVYGDANALFRTEAFRGVGGYETDRDTSWEDWEAFVKLDNAGCAVGVVPEYLFAYRHLDGGFSRVTQRFRNHQRVLRQVFQTDNLSPSERTALWTALVGLQQRFEDLNRENHALRLQVGALHHRLAEMVSRVVRGIPLVSQGVRGLLRSGRRAWRYWRGPR